MKNNKIKILFTVFLCILSSCENSNVNTKDINTKPSIEAQGPNDFISNEVQYDFQDIKEKILDTNCINCHTGKHNNFDQYIIVKLTLNDILNRIRSKSFLNRMPKGREPLTENLISIVETWANQGAPEFKQISSQNAFPEYYSFEDIKTLVLQPNHCLECHSEYESYQAVVKDINKIFESIDNGCIHLNLDKTFPKLATDKEFNILLNWINSGKPELLY